MDGKTISLVYVSRDHLSEDVFRWVCHGIPIVYYVRQHPVHLQKVMGELVNAQHPQMGI